MSKKPKLNKVRGVMAKNRLDAYIVPNTDAHQSEYIADHCKALTWLSSFTGSAGNLVITKKFAGLWTDSRYFLQAEAQLENNDFELVKLKTPHVPEYVDWLIENMKVGAQVGLDENLFSVQLIREMKKAFARKKIKIVHLDLISQIWKDRPSMPKNPIYVHETKYAGQSRRKKLAKIQEEIKKKGATHHLITALDDIAWTLNLRGSDVKFNPVGLAYLLIGLEETTLFIGKRKIDETVAAKLEKADIRIASYHAIKAELDKLGRKNVILLDPQKVNFALFRGVNSKCKTILDFSIPSTLKSIKNETEIKHLHNVMVKDGAALVRFYRWLENALESGVEVTEYEVAQMLEQFRNQEETFVGNSFSTIAGFAGNGAIVHYRPSRKRCSKLNADGVFLLDSGGQYLDGTTDITRTTCIGTPSAEQKRDFTLVLKGHIALAQLIFPENTKGHQMEVLARQFLWSQGLNYGHGTGHGVGFFLNVHEGPQSFSNSITTNPNAGFRVGMLTSNEPGFYKAGEYGIRLENLLLAVPHLETKFGKFLKFETLTLFPIETSMIDISLMTQQEKDWLNAYHERVRMALWDSINDDDRIWLVGKTRAI